MVEVTLGRFELSDVDAMMGWASNPDETTFCRWDPYEAREPLLAYLRDTVVPRRRRPGLRRDRRRRVHGADGRGELGYVVARRALRVVFAKVEGLRRVEALVDVDNSASQRVAEKARLRREGVLRRHYWHKGKQGHAM
nr:unnamed protein product [Digitaria exilis]